MDAQFVTTELMSMAPTVVTSMGRFCMIGYTHSAA